MTIEEEIKSLSREELLQLFELMSFRNSKWDKALHEILAMIRANRRAQGGRG